MDGLVEVYIRYVSMSRTSFAAEPEAKTEGVYGALYPLSKDFTFTQASTKAPRGPNGALLNLHLIRIDYRERVLNHLLGQ